MVKRGSRQAVVILLVAVAAAWAWFASGVRTFTGPAEVLTFVPGLAVLVLTLRPSAERAGRPSRDRGAPEPFPRSGVLPWIVVLAAVIGWELAELFSQPRHLHPTFSSVLNALLSTHPGRASSATRCGCYWAGCSFVTSVVAGE